MKHCDCRPLDDGWYRCVCECGVTIKSRMRHVFHVCGQPSVGGTAAATIEPPSMLGKAWNFASAAAKHVAAGMPQCSQEQVDARFAVCQACEHFDGRACRQCGCPVVREKAFVSKLSWANERCPAGKWGPVES
jgi:hypothetical protein